MKKMRTIQSKAGRRILCDWVVAVWVRCCISASEGRQTVAGGEKALRNWRETVTLWRRALGAPYAPFAWVAVANAHPVAPYSR